MLMGQHEKITSKVGTAKDSNNRSKMELRAANTEREILFPIPALSEARVFRPKCRGISRPLKKPEIKNNRPENQRGVCQLGLGSQKIYAKFAGW